MRANYDYAGKYLLEVVGRYDGSYRYAPSKRWTFFPSVSADGDFRKKVSSRTICRLLLI